MSPHCNVLPEAVCCCLLVNHVVYIHVTMTSLLWLWTPTKFQVLILLVMGVGREEEEEEEEHEEFYIRSALKSTLIKSGLIVVSH